MDGNHINIGKIFSEAGRTFSRLGDLTRQVDYPNSQGEGIWTETDKQLLLRAIRNFAEELDLISSQLRIRLQSREVEASLCQGSSHQGKKKTGTKKGKEGKPKRAPANEDEEEGEDIAVGGVSEDEESLINSLQNIQINVVPGMFVPEEFDRMSGVEERDEDQHF